MNRNCSVCNIKIDEKNYLKDGTVCKSCCDKNKKKININTLIQSEQPKSDNDKKKRKLAESVNFRTLIIGFAICGKTYLMNYILHQQQEPILINTKALNQYPKIKARTTDEIQPLEI